MKARATELDESHLTEKETNLFTFISWSALHFSSIYKSQKRALDSFLFHRRYNLYRNVCTNGLIDVHILKPI